MSYQVVKAAIEFEGPPRIPIEDLGRPEDSDIVGVGFEPQIWKWHQVEHGKQECTDLFGCIRQRHDGGIGQVYKAPLENWDEFDRLILPNVEELRERTIEQLSALPENRFVMGDIGQFLTKIFEIRGFENTLFDLALHADRIKALGERLTTFAIERMKMYVDIGGIHAISIYDDWGTQNSMLLSPQQWYTLFFDFYKNLFDCAHNCGMYVYFHFYIFSTGMFNYVIK